MTIHINMLILEETHSEAVNIIERINYLLVSE